MKILFVVLCALMFFCSCRGDKTEEEDTGGGQADTNQTDTEGGEDHSGGVEQKPTEGTTSGTQGGVQGGVPVAEATYTLSIGSKDVSNPEKNVVNFAVLTGDQVSKAATTELKNGACVEFSKKDFSSLRVMVSSKMSKQHLHGCGPGREVSLCIPQSGNWLLTLVADCWLGSVLCKYTWETSPLDKRATDCLTMEDVKKKPSS